MPFKCERMSCTGPVISFPAENRCGAMLLGELCDLAWDIGPLYVWVDDVRACIVFLLQVAIDGAVTEHACDGVVACIPCSSVSGCHVPGCFCAVGYELLPSHCSFAIVVIYGMCLAEVSVWLLSFEPQAVFMYLPLPFRWWLCGGSTELLWRACICVSVLLLSVCLLPLVLCLYIVVLYGWG
jgi:hypothetical protein